MPNLPRFEQQPINVELVLADPWKTLLSFAWTNSRPNVSPELVDYLKVLSIDAPVSEMAGIVINCRVPILLREIIASMRDHIMWARTSRVDRLTDVWLIVAEAKTTHMDRILGNAEAMTQSIEEGEKQDTFRQHLPLGYLTDFTLRLSLRSAIKLVIFMKELGKRHWETIGGTCLAFHSQLADHLDSLGVPVEELAKVIKAPDYCPAPHWPGNEFTPKQGRFGDMLVIHQLMPISLRAHVIRHRTLAVVDRLSALFDDPDVWSIPISRSIEVEVSATVHTWAGIVAKRNCWLAQADLWAPLVNAVNEKMGQSEVAVPCSDGVCPYGVDALERINKNDPGLPCPRHLNLSKDIRERELFHRHFPDPWTIRQELYKYILDSKRPGKFWASEIVDATQLEKVS